MVYILLNVKMCLIFGSFPYQKQYCYFLSNIEGFFQSNFINSSFKTSKSDATPLRHCKQQSPRTTTAIEQPSTSFDGNETFIKYSIIFTTFVYCFGNKPNAKIPQIIVLDIKLTPLN
jgi:hypothetical protein